MHIPQKSIEFLTFFAFATLSLGMLLKPFAYADPAFFYYDDFFYYFIPARHFLASGSFYFYPGMPTNGFQPLWMAVIVAELALSGQHEMVFFVLLNLTLWGLLLLSCRQAFLFVREQGGHGMAGLCAAGSVGAIQICIATSGMEVALTTPLLLMLTRTLFRAPLTAASDRFALAVGLLGCLVVLSRLDAALLLLPVGLVLLYQDRPSLRTLLFIMAGALPLWGYLLANLYYTSMLLPISGTAKLLKETLTPNPAPLLVFKSIEGLVILCFLMFIAYFVGGWLLYSAFMKKTAFVSRDDRFQNLREQRLWIACVVAVPLYYAAYTLLTDWELWFWYLYPVGWLAALLILRMERMQCPAWTSLIPTLCLLTLSFMNLAYKTPERNDIWQRALVIRNFVQKHPGRYAMGDCAGSTAYLMRRSLLQSEGIISDSELLHYIRDRQSLTIMLKHYNIDYYIATGPKRQADGCYTLKEPFLAGPASPAMLGKSCNPPLIEYGSMTVFRTQDIIK